MNLTCTSITDTSTNSPHYTLPLQEMQVLLYDGQQNKRILTLMYVRI